MSDDDFNENEEFDFEYSGSDQEEAQVVDLENLYYEAKGWIGLSLFRPVFDCLTDSIISS